MSDDLLGSWSGLLRVLLVGTLAYVGLVLVLRVTGKRTLSKMNAFDLVVTVALGSALATTMLSKSTPLLEGLAGMTLLVVLQFAVTWLSVRSERVQDVVKAQPSILLHRGEWRRAAMRRERVTEEEVLAAVRAQGSTSIDASTTVVLETDGALSVLTGSSPGAGSSSLANVLPAERHRRHPVTRSRMWLLVSRVLRALWFRPAVFAMTALAVLLLAPEVALILPDGLMKLIGLEGVYDLLNALASTLLTVSIFSLGILAASLRATAQGATPRVRPLLAEDRTARNAISTFIGGFVFAVVGIVILSTGYYSDAAKVLMFFITCLLILALIVALVRWIGRLSRLGGVAESIDLAEEATRKALLALAADPLLGGVRRTAPPPRGSALGPVAPGFVQAIDIDELGGLAKALDVEIHLLSRPGAFAGPGRPLLLTSRPLEDEPLARLRDTFVMGHQRTFEADARFGLVVLSEIASRALSPAVNDPGTAIDVVTTSTRLLCEWAAAVAQAKPEVRWPQLHVEPVTVDHLLEDAFRWIARDGAALAEVQIWMLKSLGMLVAQDRDRFGSVRPCPRGGGAGAC